MTTLIKSEPLGRVQPPATIAITALGRELKAAGRSIVSLGIGQPDFATPQHIIDANVKISLTIKPVKSPSVQAASKYCLTASTPP